MKKIDNNTGSAIRTAIRHSLDKVDFHEKSRRYIWENMGWYGGSRLRSKIKHPISSQLRKDMYE